MSTTNKRLVIRRDHTEKGEVTYESINKVIVKWDNSGTVAYDRCKFDKYVVDSRIPEVLIPMILKDFPEIVSSEILTAG